MTGIMRIVRIIERAVVFGPWPIGWVAVIKVSDSLHDGRQWGGKKLIISKLIPRDVVSFPPLISISFALAFAFTTFTLSATSFLVTIPCPMSCFAAYVAGMHIRAVGLAATSSIVIAADLLT